MPKLSKKQKEVLTKCDFKKVYSLNEGIQVLKETAYEKFDASIDIAVRLGVTPQKADQMVRGTVSLPHGTGKNPRILVICDPDKEKEAKEAGAEHVGLEEYLKKIAQGWTDIDKVITVPTLMAKVGKLGKILGPRGLMPNPKTGTVTLEVAKAVEEIKAGKIEFKVDKHGIIHTSVGRKSFTLQKIVDNTKELLKKLIKLKPSTAKGTYIKKCF